MPEPTVDDGDRNTRSLRGRQRDVVAAVRKRRSAECRADIHHLVSAHRVRGDRIRAETGGGRRGVREHFRERETRFV